MEGGFYEQSLSNLIFIKTSEYRLLLFALLNDGKIIVYLMIMRLGFILKSRLGSSS